MLNVLHISDLHFTSDEEGLRRDYSHAAASAILRLVDELLLQGVLGSSPAVVITGDLVQAGGSKKDGGQSDFDAVQQCFLQPLLEKLKIAPNRVFVVPGNHEMNLAAIGESNVLAFDTKCSQAEINEDLRSKLHQFFNFIEGNGYSSVNSSNPRMVSFKCDDQQIVCFNGLVGSYSRGGFGDKGNLFVLPTEFGGDLAEIENFAVVLTHHPLSWYTDECEIWLQDYFAKRRCRLISGHIHNDGLTEISPGNGSFLSLQAGASADVGNIEFCVSVAWLPPSNAAAVRLYRYNKAEACFPLTPVVETLVAPGHAQSFMERSIAFFDPKLLDTMADEAKRLSERELLEQSGHHPSRYVPPDIMFFPEDQFSGKRTTLDELAKDQGNVVLSGYELSGKSSLLAYMCYQENIQRKEVSGPIGVSIDFRELQTNSDVTDLVIKRLTDLGSKGYQAEYLLSVGRVRLYIDNFDANDRRTITKFLGFSAKFPEIRWTVMARGSERFMPSSAPSDFENSDVSYYQLAETTLPTVLKMIESHKSRESVERPRAIVQRVFQSIQNLNAPRTMFYVSSMLDVFLNDGSVEPLNKYLLIENLISDRIRDAHRLVFTGQPVDMQMIDAFVGVLAFDLFCREVSFVSTAEFLTLAENFIERKGLQRKRFDPEKVLNVLVSSRILRLYESGYGFVILSVEDYFLAKHMGHDEEFRSKVLSPDGLLMLPAVAEFYVAQNPNDRPRIESIFEIIDCFEAEVRSFVSRIDDAAVEAIKCATPGEDCRTQDELLDKISEVDSADEPTMIRFSDPEPVGQSRRVRYSVEEQGAVLLQLGASVLGVTRTLDREDRIEIFKRLRQLLLICIKGIPLVAQHLADGHEVRLRGTTVKAEYTGSLSVQEDRFYIILRGMLYNLYRQFATWAGSPSFFQSAAALRDEEEDELIAAALFAQNIEADLSESLNFVPLVAGKVNSMILREILARLYLDAMTLVPLERGDEARGIDFLVDLTAEVFPPKVSTADALIRHKDALRRNFSETIGINTYIGRRLRTPSPSTKS